MSYNLWHQALLDSFDIQVGDAAFAEFTLDANGMELRSGTPKLDSYASAPWMLPAATTPIQHAPEYLSAWEQLYDPLLLERAYSEAGVSGV